MKHKIAKMVLMQTSRMYHDHHKDDYIKYGIERKPPVMCGFCRTLVLNKLKKCDKEYFYKYV